MHSLMYRMKCLLIPFKLVGLFPFTSNIQKIKSRNQITALIVSVSSILLGFVTLFGLIKLLKLKNYSLTSYILFILYLICWSSGAVSWLQAIITSDDRVKIFSLLENVDSIFKNNLCVDIDHEKTKRELKRKSCIYLVSLGVFVILFGSSIYFTAQVKEVSYAGLILATIYRINILLMVIYIEMIVYRLEMIYRLMKRPHITLCDSLLYDIECVVSKIGMLKKIYGDLWKITVLVNGCFGWTLLVVMIYKFIVLTFQFYSLVLNVTQRTSSAPMAWIGR